MAILSSLSFDASTVDELSVTGAAFRLKGKGTPMASVEDTCDDGLLDLVVHVSTEALALGEGDVEAVLQGMTVEGTSIRGTDSVRVVPRQHRGAKADDRSVCVDGIGTVSGGAQRFTRDKQFTWRSQGFMEFASAPADLETGSLDSSRDVPRQRYARTGSSSVVRGSHKEVTVMRKRGATGLSLRVLLVGLGVALLAIPVVGAKPGKGPKPVTEVCTLTGDVSSGESSPDGRVEIGVKAWTWELLVPGTEIKTSLWLKQNVLNDLDGTPYGPPFDPPLEEGAYWGQARILKDQGRFDFDFDFDLCVSPTSDDVPPYGNPDYPDGAHLCPFRLVVLNGVYDSSLDRVDWSAASEVHLVDYSQGPPCEADPADPNCVDPGEYRVGWGPLSELHAQFHAEGDETGTERLCKDGEDNDQDGLTDCADPDCAGKRWCR